MLRLTKYSVAPPPYCAWGITARWVVYSARCLSRQQVGRIPHPKPITVQNEWVSERVAGDTLGNARGEDSVPERGSPE